ncbi:FecR family protein [Phenylobacterium sp.]|jgi:transmembrane sensor|uniref:FecR family protein n=1 Tax=Phenylobacterium sp. TaxID=1871053 RepID=UPI002E31B176|nr:FecR domain-containing protein [Phenylobacterium sp.]HEX3363912.1 FecR domain-containing protein [Phenylobacterium sp.]
MRANDNAAPADALALEEAADWIDRLGELSEADEQDLRAWLRASDANAQAFERMRHTLLDPALLQAAEQARNAPPALPVTAQPRRVAAASPQSQRRPLRLGLMAASLIGAVAVAVVVGRQVADRPEAALQLATAVGARSDYRLEDASVVHLNADSRVSVRFSRSARDVALQKGDAMFDVAKNPRRPFVVQAGTAAVTAVGTSFEVDRLDDAVEVRVFEGVVRVARPEGPAYLAHRGEWLRLAAGQPAVSGQFAPALDDTWRSDWLVADQMPLKDVVARLNRYSRDRIAVANARTGELKVTGRFRLRRTDDAVAMVSALLHLDAARGGQRVLTAPTSE